jgi:hypothetical protein
VYFNEARLACDYFSTLNYECPNSSNPADYFMELMSLDNVNDFQSEGSPLRTEKDVLNEYNKKINFLNQQY